MSETTGQIALISGDPLRWPEPLKRNEAMTCRKVAEKLWPEIRDWLVQGGKKNRDETEVREDLADKLRRAYDWEGFELAKELERGGWDADAELVEVLTNADGHFYSVRDSFIKDWVNEHGVTPQFKTGDPVRVRQGDPGINLGWAGKAGEKGRVFQGIVAGIHDTTYTVSIPELGHVGYEATPGIRSGTIGSCLRWDYVEASDAACRADGAGNP